MWLYTKPYPDVMLPNGGIYSTLQEGILEFIKAYDKDPSEWFTMPFEFNQRRRLRADFEMDWIKVERLMNERLEDEGAYLRVRVGPHPDKQGDFLLMQVYNLPKVKGRERLLDI